MAGEVWGARIRAAVVAACHPEDPVGASVGAMAVTALFAPWHLSDAVPLGLVRAPASAESGTAIDADALVVALFRQEGQSLVRLARIFVDDRNAAEDLIQEAFLLARDRARH